jgi:cephalosporin hydroxylase
MNARDFMARAVARLTGRPSRDVRRLEKYELESLDGYLPRTDLGRLYVEHRGRPVRKWLHYMDAYDRHFAPYRGRPLTLLEIGVSEGGSLELWRDYFGKDAVITGIDVDPQCASRVDAPNRVLIGSQDDARFLRSVVAEAGAPDIIIDDGSHVSRHQRASFKTLFPLLKTGGIYVIEDMHTSYWPGDYEGGYKRSGTAAAMVKSLIDDVNGAWHDKPSLGATAIHVYDSIAFIEKGEPERLGQIRIG